MKILARVLAALVLLVVQMANAGVIRQNFELKVDGESVSTEGPNCRNSSVFWLRCGETYIGNVYRGSFTLDDTWLQSDGLKESVPALDFQLATEKPFAFFSSTHVPYNAAYLPGLIVSSGRVIDFLGLMHGSGDTYFLDFFGNGRFRGTDTNVMSDPGVPAAPFRTIEGSLTFYVPEPAGPALVGGALAALALVLRSRNRDLGSIIRRLSR